MIAKLQSPKHASDRQRRWPDHADDFRIAAMQAAQESTDTLLLSQHQIDALLTAISDPALRERLLVLARQNAEAVAYQEYIQRMLTAARMGRT